MKDAIVIKIGSNSLLGNGLGINRDYLRRIINLLEELRQKGKFPLLVLSGAVATGKFNEASLISSQACAARGQFIITALMHKFGEDADVKFGQFLLSRQDIIDRSRYATLQKTFVECLNANITPLINENDATAALETHDFIDNDQVATIVGMAVGAESIFLFTNVAGVFRRLSKKEKILGETPIAQIADVNKELVSMYTGKKSLAGRGGMESKLRAARIASFVGMTTYILNGEILEHAVEVIDGQKCRGTVCLPWPRPITLTDRSRWLIVSHTSGASIKIDSGAVKALRERRSLLAVGVTKIYGTFDIQDSVEIIDQNNNPVALGVAGISSVYLGKVVAAKNRPFNVEVIHADYLILLPV